MQEEVKEIKQPKVLVTTDTHGHLDELVSCMEQAGFDNETDTLIHLGDVVDRGPQSFELVEYLLKVNNLIRIKGNHDDWFNEWLTKGHHPGGWYHGGIETISSYAAHCDREIKMEHFMGNLKTDFNSTDVPDTHKAFFANQLDHYTDEQNRFFCHAGYDPMTTIDTQEDFTFYWNRALITELVDKSRIYTHVDNYPDVNDFKRVFIGHTPTTSFRKSANSNLSSNWLPSGEYFPAEPMYLGQLVNLDTGGCFGGKISLIDITDDSAHILYQA